MISSPADTLFSVVSAPVFLFVGHGVGQNAILVFCLHRARHSHAALTEYMQNLVKCNQALLQKRRLATPLRKGVMQLGHERWTKVLRFLICFLMVLWIMAYIAPKAC